MAKNHGTRDQRRAAKQKAKRLAKRSEIIQRASKDPTVRLQRAAKWSVVQALVSDKLWKNGIGHLVIARRDSEGALVFAVFLVDVYCLGVKNAFWRAGTSADLETLIRQISTIETMQEISPACFTKIVRGAVEFAQSFGFPPHPDYRHTSMLLDGIDPESCLSEFTFGRDGRPFYIQGPNESPALAAAISRRVHDREGHYLVSLSHDDLVDSTEFGREIDEFESDEEASVALESL